MEIHLGLSQSEAGTTGGRGTDEGSKLKATGGWYNNGNGTNESGFTALPGGYRYYLGSFGNLSTAGNWWCSTGYSPADAWHRVLTCNYTQVYRYYKDKRYGFSIRCVRD